MTADLFADLPDVRPARETIADGAVLLRGFARPVEAELIAALREIIMQAQYYAGWPRGPAAMRRFQAAKNAPDSSWREVADKG